MKPAVTEKKLLVRYIRGFAAFLHRRHRLVTASFSSLMLTFAAAAALAQKNADYPARLVRIVVPYSPGIGVDVAARILAPKLAQRLGQPVIVENKPGASSLIGTEFVARAPADGYTLGMAVNTLVITASTRAVPFDPVKDFAPIIKIGTGAFLLTANSAVPTRDLQELVTYAKAWPGKVSYGTPGAGTPAHLATELLKQEAGIDLFHVPYKGMPASVIGHVNGEVALMITPLEMARPHMGSGKLRALAVAGAQRISALPDLPTVAELGYPGFSLDLWYALLAPAGTPPAIVNRLNAEMAQLLRETETREALKRQGIEVTGGTPNELAALIRDELAKWKKVVASAKIRLEE